ncbi:T9SS type B sorting domain-containing protein [Gramella sp. MT6]|uniref:T9SS type B sorting domain-containing protein n=1 Tax=Gramella sp. MT6 TaxID=2705471 RepID=UPI001C5F5D40|nr:T9SS type B sorting domain-containing protein [Gramella sp. MT6]QYA25484.1 T9SS type B sorting domain-containing protein [Gramella sp. MT6]
MSAQGSLCSDIEPFCAGDQRLTFPNSNETNSTQINGELGPDYGCLLKQPYPAWFFLQIEDPGNLNFRISQSENRDGSGAPLDVDFVVWGPFERGDDYCDGNSLNADKIVDCSYLDDATENMSIPNAQTNEIYVVVITNFRTLPGYISLEQTSSQGSTDCSILDLDLGDQVSVCDDNEYTIDGTTEEASKYEWFVFNETTSQYDLIPGEDGSTLTVNTSGNYKLIVTDEIENKTEEDDVTVTFYDSPAIGEVSNFPVCTEDAEFVDLNEISTDLLAPNDNSEMNYEVFFYASQEDVDAGSRIPDASAFPFEEGKIIYAEVIDTESGCRSEAVNFELKTFDFPEFELSENTIFCVDGNMNVQNPVSLGEDLGDGYFYEWRDGVEIISTNAIIELNELPSNPQVSVTISNPESGCELEFVTNVAAVTGPETVQVDISGSDFGDGYNVEASTDDFTGKEFAILVYRLDNGSWQDSNVFNGVTPGSHTVSVRDLNGCGAATSESFFLVGYPRFFTPNSDGYNDHWNLITDRNISIKKLYVFDRYGKLITRLNPTNKGWDGTYNGDDLPADDYWFRVEFVDEKTGEYQEYMSNFTLMR